MNLKTVPTRSLDERVIKLVMTELSPNRDGFRVDTSALVDRKGVYLCYFRSYDKTAYYLLDTELDERRALSGASVLIKTGGANGVPTEDFCPTVAKGVSSIYLPPRSGGSIMLIEMFERAANGLIAPKRALAVILVRCKETGVYSDFSNGDDMMKFEDGKRMTEASLGLFRLDLQNILRKNQALIGTNSTFLSLVVPIIGPAVIGQAISSGGIIDITQYDRNLEFINAKDAKDVPQNWRETDGMTRFFIDEITDDRNISDTFTSFPDVDGNVCEVDERVVYGIQRYKYNFQSIYKRGVTRLHADECEDQLFCYSLPGLPDDLIRASVMLITEDVKGLNIILVRDVKTNTYMLPGGIIGEHSKDKELREKTLNLSELESQKVTAIECVGKELREKTFNLFNLDLESANKDFVTVQTSRTSYSTSHLVFAVPIAFKKGVDFRQGYTANSARHNSPTTNGIVCISVKNIDDAMSFVEDKLDLENVMDVDGVPCNIHWSVKGAVKSVDLSDNYWYGRLVQDDHPLGWPSSHREKKTAPDFNEVRVGGKDVCTKDMVCYALQTNAQRAEEETQKVKEEQQRVEENRLREIKRFNADKSWWQRKKEVV